MRAIKLFVYALLLFVGLPVAIVGVLGLLLSPFQTTARATEPDETLEACDLMLSEAVKEQLRQAEAEPMWEAEEFEEVELADFDDAAPADVAEPIAPTVWDELEGAAAEAQVEAQSQVDHYSSEQLRTQGVINDGDLSYTWYSQRVLPGGGLDIEGRHVSDEGYVVDAQNRIVVASSDLPYGTQLSVPFGSGAAVVLDTGCAPGVLDVYTDF